MIFAHSTTFRGLVKFNEITIFIVIHFSKGGYHFEETYKSALATIIFIPSLSFFSDFAWGSIVGIVILNYQRDHNSFILIFIGLEKYL